MVYAVGSTGAVPASVPGAAEHAHPIAELEQAQRLRAAIDDLPSGAPITVVGAGLTGIETATELAEQGRDVTLVGGGRPAPYLHERGRRSVAEVLRRLGSRCSRPPSSPRCGPVPWSSTTVPCVRAP